MEGIGEELPQRLNEGRRKESEEEFWGEKKQQREGRDANDSPPSLSESSD